MSLYSDRFDQALSKVPWVSKTSEGRPYLFKYALHPDRAGYLFIATDLETVCFEALTTTGVTTRVGEVATRMNDFDAPQPGSLPLEEEQKQIEETLAALEGMFDGGNSLAGATVLAERDDYYDLVITLRSPKLNWQFNLTELRGRVPLTFLTKQLLAPFAVLIGEDRGVQVTGEPAAAVSTIASDPGVVRAWRRIVGAPPPTSQASRVSTQSRQTSAAPGSPFRAPATPTPRRHSPARTKSPDATPRPVTPVRPSASQAQANQPPMSPTPYKRPYNSALVSSSSRPGSPSEPAAHSRYGPLMTDVTIPPSSPPAAAPSSDAGVPSSDVPTSDLSSQVRSSTQDPLLPSQADKPKRKKKKDKAAELAEEEAEADRRRAEMKRKMQAGAKKGGGLGRRRF